MLYTFCLHSNPFISLYFIEYIVTGDSVYYSGSLPLVEVFINYILQMSIFRT
jgi:hypothetical protein